MQYLIIIDTDGFAGNFERELGYFMTGFGGEFGRSSLLDSDEIDQHRIELPVVSVPSQHDDYWMDVYSHMVPTVGRFNAGVGVAYDDTPVGVALAEAAFQERREKNIDNPYYAHRKTMTKYPAFESVGIVVSEKPTGTTMRRVMHRAEKFFRTYRHAYETKFKVKSPHVKVLGMRLQEVDDDYMVYETPPYVEPRRFEMTHGVFGSVSEFTEVNAPWWLKGDVAKPHCDRSWFWHDHVMRLGVGETTQTDFQTIKRVG